MKFKILLLSISIFFAVSCSAQSFFKPLPKPGQPAMGIAKVGIPTTQNAIRPVVAISALVSDGTQLAGGFGAGFNHLQWDDASQTWVSMYSVSLIGFLGTNGTSITGTGGLVFGIPGTAGIIGVGPGYDFTGKKVVLLTGVQIMFK